MSKIIGKYFIPPFIRFHLCNCKCSVSIQIGVKINPLGRAAPVPNQFDELFIFPFEPLPDQDKAE